jgi:hypothetical protein
MDSDIIQIEVLKAIWIQEYIPEISFSDGEIQDVDTESFLKNSKHPEIHK